MAPVDAALDRADLDHRLIDGGEVVSLTRWPRFTPQETYLINSWYSFLLEAESTPGQPNNISEDYITSIFRVGE
jgi:hypothetical protein